MCVHGLGFPSTYDFNILNTSNKHVAAPLVNADCGSIDPNYDAASYSVFGSMMYKMLNSEMLIPLPFNL